MSHFVMIPRRFRVAISGSLVAGVLSVIVALPVAAGAIVFIACWLGNEYTAAAVAPIALGAMSIWKPTALVVLVLAAMGIGLAPFAAGRQCKGIAVAAAVTSLSGLVVAGGAFLVFVRLGDYLYF